MVALLVVSMEELLEHYRSVAKSRAPVAEVAGQSQQVPKALATEPAFQLYQAGLLVSSERLTPLLWEVSAEQLVQQQAHRCLQSA